MNGDHYETLQSAYITVYTHVSTYIQCMYIRTYMCTYSQHYATLHAHIHTHVRTYEQTHLLHGIVNDCVTISDTNKSVGHSVQWHLHQMNIEGSP